MPDLLWALVLHHQYKWTVQQLGLAVRMRSFYGDHILIVALLSVYGENTSKNACVVHQVGDWDAVRAKCFAGKMQPSLLFFEAAWSADSYSPSATVPLPPQA